MSGVKKVLSFFTYIQVLASLLMIGLGIYLLVQNLILAVASAILLLCLGIALFIISCFGVIGSHRKSAFCLCLFQIGIIPLTLCALGLGIGATIYSNEIFADGNNQFIKQAPGYDCNFNATAPWSATCKFTHTNSNVPQIMQNLFTTTQYAASWWGRYDAKDGIQACSILYGLAPQDQLFKSWGLTAINVGTPEDNACKCDQADSNQAPSDFSAYAAFMQYIEKTNQCAGVGVAYPYYIFNDFSKTPIPQGLNNECSPYIKDTLESWFQIAYITSYTVFGFLFINTILSLTLCFKKGHHHHDGDIYTRMNYYDD